MKSFLCLLLCLSFEPSAAVTVTNPLRVTHIGPDLNKNYDAADSAIVFNNATNESYVVFEATQFITGTDITLLTETEIYAQRINPVTGLVIGVPSRISQMGPENNTLYDANSPDVAYNSAQNEYLVVWHGDTNVGQLVEGESEIWGRRINAITGQPIGAQFRISQTGADGNRTYDARQPVIAYNSTNNNYLVVWEAELGIADISIGETELVAQQLNSNGIEMGANDFRISDMGPNNDGLYDANSPDIVYNPINNEFMVVWHADDDAAGHIDEEFEIYGQRINANTGAEIGANDFIISSTGFIGLTTSAAKFPSICWNSALNHYLVSWSADPATGLYVINELEIFAQTLSATGVKIGQSNFAISNMGAIGLSEFDAFRPSAEYFPSENAYVVLWRGDTLIDNEYEVYYQMIDQQTQARILPTDVRLTNAGPDMNVMFEARRTNITYNSNNESMQLIWEQEDLSSDQISGEYEIYTASLTQSNDIIFSNSFE